MSSHTRANLVSSHCAMDAAPKTADPSKNEPHIRVPPTLRNRMAMCKNFLTTPAVFGPRCARTEQTPHNQVVQRVSTLLDNARTVTFQNGMRQTTQHLANPHIKTTLRQVARQNGQEPNQNGTTTEKKPTLNTTQANNLYDQLALKRTPHDGTGAHPHREAVFFEVAQTRPDRM